ncbi:MAG: bifunctional diaminohydroxyphosphoribosylaminopyrimidine deaminase/5-amino-6-(5-phosphoribosylamino)uracil reductase RibD [Xanthobacteraceae bacterium]|nr:bifunctional diaminohydroxyphosphoribosylaminopyrimidine deaminase/5-amino-6-(5-phosphoribosylamino)uracil reductase RibD [Xanthobacteraceae bacterium]
MNAVQVSNWTTPVGIDDARFMDAALQFGRRNMGMTAPNPSVGAIIVKTSGTTPVIVARGVTARGGRPHAETEALKAAGNAAKGSTVYVTLEPCAHQSKTPPCANALVNAQVGRVVIAIEDTNPLVSGNGIRMLRDAGIETIVGIGAAQAKIDHAGHFRRVRDGRPHILLKIAMSADGKTALAGRKPARISGPVSMAEAHILRATCDAIMVGSGTVIADNPKLDCRLPGIEDRSPIRVVFDGSLKIPLDCHLVQTAKTRKLIVIAGENAPADAQKALEAKGAEVVRVQCTKDRYRKPVIADAMHELGNRGITRLLAEGGPVLSASLLKNDLVDEAAVVRAPVPLGVDAIDALEDLPLDALLASPKLKVIEERMLGEDRMIRMFRK